MEQLTKAELTAGMLLADVIEAQSTASNPLLEIILRDLIVKASDIKNRLSEARNAAETITT